jgi:hypothetical protein
MQYNNTQVEKDAFLIFLLKFDKQRTHAIQQTLPIW